MTTPEQRARLACQGASHLEAAVAQQIREATHELEAELIKVQREVAGIAILRIEEAAERERELSSAFAQGQQQPGEATG